MTVAMILNFRGMNSAEDVANRQTVRADARPAQQLRVAGPAANDWRLVELWASSEEIDSGGKFSILRIADTFDGEPTWEDAEWQ